MCCREGRGGAGHAEVVRGNIKKRAKQAAATLCKETHLVLEEEDSVAAQPQRQHFEQGCVKAQHLKAVGAHDDAEKLRHGAMAMA